MRVWWPVILILTAACAAPAQPAPGVASAPGGPAPTAALEGILKDFSPAPAGPSPTAEVVLKNYGPAPELTNAVWLNVEAPLRLADLRGRVVLIDMWTFG
jgi:hypothetical protein